MLAVLVGVACGHEVRIVEAFFKQPAVEFALGAALLLGFQLGDLRLKSLVLFLPPFQVVLVAVAYEQAVGRLAVKLDAGADEPFGVYPRSGLDETANPEEMLVPKPG